MANLEQIIANKSAQDSQWKAQQQAERENITEMQDCGIELIASDPDQFMRYLTMQGDNPTYSAGNIAIAMVGLPDATVIGTAERWQILHRSVIADEKGSGVKIFARDPKTRQYIHSDIYDISQTQGADLKHTVFQDGSKEITSALETLLNYSKVPAVVDKELDEPAYYDEEKKELSDSEVEKWEDKIKDSILRRDSNLSTISNAMKNIMLQGAMVNGKQMYLSDFGIETLGYFSAAENERNAYHINGDEDDLAVSSKTNDLKAAIAADPDAVIGFFSQLSQNLYNELDKQSRSVEGVRSFGSFYDDKKMKEDYDSYKDKIKKQEARLTALEDKWYKKFSAMETALARMQSNQSAISSLLGGM